jgi:hypothetical protein
MRREVLIQVQVATAKSSFLIPKIKAILQNSLRVNFQLHGTKSMDHKNKLLMSISYDLSGEEHLPI